MNIFAENIYNLIGNTPLIEIKSPNKNVKIFIKLEKLNPSGSFKDRIIKEIITNGERNGILTKDKTLIESTSGNTGISIAMIGGLLGYKVKIIMPRSMSVERRKIMEAYGADLELVDGNLDDALLRAKQLSKDGNYFWINQYSNGYNVSAHYKTTGPEIWRQTQGKVTHFIAGMGTGGTIMGVGGYLKKKNDKVKIIGVKPYTEIQGLKNLEKTKRPDILDLEKIDEIMSVKTDQSFLYARKMARQGLLVGMSSGATIYAAFEKARKIKRGVIVAFAADGGERYLSTKIFN